jgi:transposase
MRYWAAYALFVEYDAASGRVTWVQSEKKNSLLFIALLQKLVESSPTTKVIHVVLDNFKIHSSQAAQAAVRSLGGRGVLHFLPPYCPNDNKIERLWLDVHANVTRNHQCQDMNELMRRVANYLTSRNRRKSAQLEQAA